MVKFGEDRETSHSSSLIVEKHARENLSYVKAEKPVVCYVKIAPE